MAALLSIHSPARIAAETGNVVAVSFAARWRVTTMRAPMAENRGPIARAERRRR
jgi:hypothetical protein